MANYQALGAGPVSFIDSNNSQQEIPLSAITFDSGGVVSASAWPNFQANQVVVTALLNQLVAQGLLVKGTQQAATPSLTITAVTSGTEGNMITVTFSNISSSAGTVTVALNATEIYPGLTPATLGTTLAVKAIDSKSLIYLESPVTETQEPIAFSGAIPVTGSTELIVPSGTSNVPAFTLGATDQSYNVSIQVSPDQGSAQTFTLTATGSKTATVKLAELEGSGNPFKLLVKFSSMGGSLPAPGSVTLTGGASATSTPAAAATAIVLSS